MNTYSNQQQVQTEIARLSAKKRRDRSVVEKLRLLQLKLYDKAKREESSKFYILYDKVFLPFILEEAFYRVSENKGSPGIDGVSIDQIIKSGVSDFLSDLSEDLRKRTYRPSAVKRVYIEKSDGGQRPLGIPTVRDRVAQMACKLVIEPIFEPKLVAYRLNQVIQGWLNYFEIKGVSQMQVPRRRLEDYLRERIWRYYQRKSQRGSKLHGQQAYQMLTSKYGLKRVYASSQWRPVNALSRKP